MTSLSGGRILAFGSGDQVSIPECRGLILCRSLDPKARILPLEQRSAVSCFQDSDIYINKPGHKASANKNAILVFAF